MPPFAVLLATLLVALGLVVAGRWAVRGSWRAASTATLPLVLAALLTVFVFGEDSYRDSGISRWDAYRSPGGALGPMFVLSIVLLVGSAALLGYSGLAGRRRLFRSTTLVGALGCLVLVVPTVVGFSSN